MNKPLAQMDVSRLKRAQIDNILLSRARESGVERCARLAIDALAQSEMIAVTHCAPDQYRDMLLEEYRRVCNELQR